MLKEQRTLAPPPLWALQYIKIKNAPPSLKLWSSIFFCILVFNFFLNWGTFEITSKESRESTDPGLLIEKKKSEIPQVQ